MNGSPSALRKALLFGIVCLFAFARLAYAGAACEFMSMGCSPNAVTAAGHGSAHLHGDACAVPFESPQSAVKQAPTAGGAHALPLTTAVAASMAVVPQIARTVLVDHVRGGSSPLAFFGRLRL